MLLAARPANQPGARRRFSIAEYHQMAAAGVFGPEERVELVAGEVRSMPPMGPELSQAGHVAYLAMLDRFRSRALVMKEMPISLPDDGEPVPDIALVRAPYSIRESGHPTPAEILLVIELSKSSLEYDLGEKAAAYAADGIAEYWVGDIDRRRLIVLQDPKDGAYQSVAEYGPGSSVAPLAFPDSPVPVAALLA